MKQYKYNSDYLIKLDDSVFVKDNNVERIQKFRVNLDHTITGRYWIKLKNLKSLSIANSDTFSDSLFIDQSLPNLESLILWGCSNITGNNWIGPKKLKKFKISDCHNFNTTNLINFKKLKNISIRNLMSYRYPELKLISLLPNNIFLKECRILYYKLNKMDCLKNIKYLLLEETTIPLDEWPVFNNLEVLKFSELNKLNIFKDMIFPNLITLFLFNTDLNFDKINTKNFSKVEYLVVCNYEGKFCDKILKYPFPVLYKLKIAFTSDKGIGWNDIPSLEIIHVNRVKLERIFKDIKIIVDDCPCYTYCLYD